MHKINKYLVKVTAKGYGYIFFLMREIIVPETAVIISLAYKAKNTCKRHPLIT